MAARRRTITAKEKEPEPEINADDEDDEEVEESSSDEEGGGDGDFDEEKISLKPESEAGSILETKINLRKKKKAASVINPKNKPRLVMNVSDTRYDVVKYVGRKIFKWKLTIEPEEEWDMFWTDNAVQPDQLARMQSHQKINHFPGMFSLARKNHLGRNLMRMRKNFPEHYKFFPPTWLLPAEYGDFKAQFNKKLSKTFILKPEASCQGRGIFLTRNCDDVNPSDHWVAQRYIHKPFLIENLKFDMRIYVLLAGCDPLRIYFYKEGLARFATEDYIQPSKENIQNMCMHLTNYAINKENPNFVFNNNKNIDDIGHKRSLTSIWKYLEKEGHDVPGLMKQIKDLIIKTFCSVQPNLAHHYRSCQAENYANNMCFEILGFDVMLDYKLKPWLIEVNHTPSFTTDTPLDRNIKKGVIRDSLRLMNLTMKSKQKIKNAFKLEMQKRVLTGKKTKITPEEKAVLIEKSQKERDDYENKHLGDFEKIFPLGTPEEVLYEDFMKNAQKVFEEWTGANIRRNTKKVTETIQPNLNMNHLTKGKTNELEKIYSQKINVPAKVNSFRKITIQSGQTSTAPSQPISLNQVPTVTNINMEEINDGEGRYSIDPEGKNPTNFDEQKQSIDEGLDLVDNRDEYLLAEDDKEDDTKFVKYSQTKVGRLNDFRIKTKSSSPAYKIQNRTPQQIGEQQISTSQPMNSSNITRDLSESDNIDRQLVDSSKISFSKKYAPYIKETAVDRNLPDIVNPKTVINVNYGAYNQINPIGITGTVIRNGKKMQPISQTRKIENNLQATESTPYNSILTFIPSKSKDSRNPSKYNRNANQQTNGNGAYVVPKLVEFGFQKIDSADFKAAPLSNSNKISLKNKYGLNENYLGNINNMSANINANIKFISKAKI